MKDFLKNNTFQWWQVFKKIKLIYSLKERKGHETGIFTQQKRKFLVLKCAETLNQQSQMCAGDAASNT